jgi:glutamine amidotransferase
MTRVAILDYGMGNLRSVEKAFERVGAEAPITSNPNAASDADGLVLPGVGAFPKAMERVRELGLDQLVSERVEAGTPLLGICLGFQLLFERSSELGGADGLGILRGEVAELNADDLKIPHIGWSPIRWKKESALTEGLADEEPFYFVHSLAPVPADDSDLLGTAAYGEPFACAVDREKVFGVQFHPEKSSSAGLRLLSNFTRICAPVAASA